MRRKKSWVYSGVTLGLLLLLAGVTPASASTRAGGAGAAAGAAGPETVWLQVSAGDRHTCGITVTERLFCWGSDAAGQLGDGGANADQGVPVEVAGGRRPWAGVSAGGFHTCARTLQGQLWCWGSDFWGQLGNAGANTDVGEPVQVTGGSGLWAEVSAGYQHTCARSASRHLWCWGNDGSGRLGDDITVVERNAPVEVSGATADWTAVTAGIFHTCGIRTTGRLYCWGLDSAGQLGDGPPLSEQHTPVEVAGSRTDWIAVDLGRSHTCGLQRTGTLSCWGWDQAGQLGDDVANANQAVPVPVAGGASRWTSVTTGGYHTCATRPQSPASSPWTGSAGRVTGGPADQVFCWGLDTYGALGDGAPLANQPLPVAVTGGSGFLPAVDAGEYHTCGRRGSGRLSCWGLDSNGQVGDGGTATDQPSPVPVAG